MSKCQPNSELFSACNVLIQVPHGSYTIQNFGRKINCSVSILFPSTLTLTHLNVVVKDGSNSSTEQEIREDEKGAILQRQCSSRGLDDYVEIRGGHDLDPMFMATYNDYCGIFPDVVQDSNATARQPRVDVGCGNTVMRLVSSGTQYNSVSFGMELFFDTQTSPCARKKNESNG